MAEFVLTASRFDFVVDRDDKGHPIRVIKYRRGDAVTGLPDHQVSRLLAAGAIAPAAEVEEVVDAAQNLDQATAELADAQTDVEEARGDAATSVSELNTQLAEPVRPKITATKKVWVEYAVARGWKAEDAEKLDKQELIEALA
ncbi:hypothetical protein SEA_GUACAMOLE_7 [Gordonia phage Guacamole]|uniref:head-tail connector protein n=1 Tax=Gordonia phage Guacamole TaxID=1821553 RepID=UPI00078DC3AC|nr:head-tail connector protein [Gordonia phage Guacamole]AXH67440.1 hypothetical protein SEA_ZARBODNAMRA_7 [Gordonia phage Zarbodnamra]QBG78482.1 hypothetical protein SEA_BARCO_7 [Gordonia phage Barco]QDB74511.1 hypothetical protein SEA_MELBA_7 [Gordonia phage Melba]QDH85328.1 hypothetical protein SEA_MINTFEN_7 [Gordonia phage MintFen]QDM56744.1 hypothetical protein SEA_JASPERJR_7 [Gordonia phage JasperJr]